MKRYRIIYYSFLFFILLVHRNNAQINTTVDTSYFDDSGKLVNLSLQNEYSFQVMKLMTLKNDFIITDDFVYNKYMFVLPDNDPSNINLAGIDKSLKLAWAYDYKMRTRYDLGKAGSYLGISKEAFAVVLAIISL